MSFFSFSATRFDLIREFSISLTLYTDNNLIPTLSNFSKAPSSLSTITRVGNRG